MGKDVVVEWDQKPVPMIYLDKKVFSEKECRMLMGLMAHYLYEVLRAIEIPGYDEL